MSLLDKASLIVTPNAYKESKLYSVVPNTTLGDMDVVRATTATRVNSAGLIEVVPRNLFTYSEQFSDAAWTKVNATISANVINSPIGTLTADKLVENSANDIHYINGASITFTAGTYSVSIFAKASERNILQIFLNGSANVNAYANFNLTTGVVSAFNDCTATIQSVGNSWYRCNLTAIIAASTVPSAYYCIQNSTTATRAASYLGNGTSGLFIWGAQLENFATATEYFPTTTRLNIPRIDYTNGSCPSLLVEPQRTNLAKNSQVFNTAFWNKDLTTVADNNTTSPDGTTNASKLTEVAGTGSHHIHETVGSFAPTIASSYTMSCFVKLPSSGAGRFVQLPFFIVGFGVNAYVNFDLLNGVVGTIGSAITASSIKSFGNGWFRISATAPATAIGLSGFQLSLITSATSVRTESYTVSAGNEKGVFMFGTQLELGAYPTSYIPTVASSVTRNADYAVNNLQTTNANWTVFIDCYFKPYEEIFNLYIGTTTSRFISFYQSFDFFRLVGNSGSGVFAGRVMSTTEGRKKIVLQNDGTDCIVFVNGVKLGAVNTSAAAPLTGTSNIEFKLYTGGNAVGSLGKLNSLFRFDTKLTDAECIALTTL